MLGNLTRDPELKKTKSGAAVGELGLAMNRSWTGEDGQRHDETTFVDVVVWGRSAENTAKYLQKGRSVLIEGRLQLDSWQDAKSGQNRSKLRVVAESVQFLGNHQQASEAVGTADASGASGASGAAVPAGTAVEEPEFSGASARGAA